MLTDMLRALEEMSLMGDNPIASKNSFIVQQMPEIRVRIMQGRDWNAIAKYQIEHFFNSDVNDPKAEMESLLRLYGSDVFEQFMEDPKCAGCGDPATQRCSKCKNEWYCSRECQIKQWKAHKDICKTMSRIREEQDKHQDAVKEAQKENIAKNQEKKPLIQEIN